MFKLTKTFFMHFLFAALLALPADAQIYKLVGPDGKTVFTDAPPLPSNTKVTTVSTARSVSPQESERQTVDWAKKETEFRKRQIDKQRKEEQSNASAQTACNSAQAKMRTINATEGRRVASINPAGGIDYLTDAQREINRKRGQEEVERNCR